MERVRDYVDDDDDDHYHHDNNNVKKACAFAGVFSPVAAYCKQESDTSNKAFQKSRNSDAFIVSNCYT
jgi:hypothetical protein